MNLETSALRRAAHLVDVAPSHVDEPAQSIELPWMLGRSSRLDDVRGTPGDAAGVPGSAAHKLGIASDAAGDARRATRQLANVGDQIRPAASQGAAQFDAILAKADADIGHGDKLRLQSLPTLAGAERRIVPGVPSAELERLNLEGLLPATSRDARREVDRLRIDLLTNTLSADGGPSASTMRDHLLDLFDRPGGRDTPGQALRLMAAADALPEHLRPFPRVGLRELSLFHPPGSTQVPTIQALEHAIGSLRASAIADGITQEAALERAVQLALVPPREVTLDRVYELAAIHQLPDGIRPTIPVSDVVERAARTGATPRMNGALRNEFSRLFDWAIAETEQGSGRFVERVAAGESIPRETIDQLIASGSRFVPDDTILHAILPHLDVAANARLRVLVGDLERLRTVLERLDVVPEHRSVAAIVETYATRNLKRLAGTHEDGYPGYPDYAELGRMAAQARFLLDLRAETVGKTAAVAAPEGASTATNVTW